MVFDVFKTSLFGNQKIVGNVFCTKDEKGEYKTKTTIYGSSYPRNKRWDGGRLLYYLSEKSIDICNEIIDNLNYDEWYRIDK